LLIPLAKIGDKWKLEESDYYLKHNYKDYLDDEKDVFRFNEEFMLISPKILYRQTASNIIAAIDTEKHCIDKTAHLIVPRENYSHIDLRYVLALLNSKLYQYLYTYISQEEAGRAFAQVKTTYIKKLPFKEISPGKQVPFIDIVHEIQLQIINIDNLSNLSEISKQKIGV